MFIFEILIYVCFAYVMYFFAKKSVEYYPDCDTFDRYSIYYMVFFTAVTALRYSVGGDYFSYVKILEQGLIVEERADQEVLWNTLVTISSSLNLSAVVGLGVCGFLQIYFLVRANLNYKVILVTLPIVMFGSRYYYDMVGAIRQVTAACFFVWFSKFIYERKLLKYLVCVFLASLFHHSAMILAIFYLIPKSFVVADRRTMMLAAFFICFSLGLTPQFASLINSIQSVAVVIGYDGYNSAISDYLTGERNEALSFGPIMLSFLLIAVILIWYGPYLKERYEDKIPIFNLWYNLSFIFSCAYFLVFNSGHLFIRPVQYLEYFQMIMAALLLYDFMIESQYSAKFKYLLIGFILIIWTSISWDIIKVDGVKNSVTYKCVLFQ